MAYPAAVNLTAQKIRRKGGDLDTRQYQVDPYWGIPEGQPPLAVDVTSGLVRPFSSYTTAATAAATFVGFADDHVLPGVNKSVWVHTRGWVEMKLQTAATVLTGDWFKPVAISGAVSDDTVVPATMPDDYASTLFRAVENCVCQPFYEPVSCPGAVPAANDNSPTNDPASRKTQRTVTVEFGGIDLATIAAVIGEIHNA